MDPHAPKIVPEQVIQGVPRQERQTVRNPVLLVGVVVEVRLCPLPQLSNCLGALLISTRPNAEADAVERMRRILLEHEGVVNTMGLTAASADLNIMWEA